MEAARDRTADDRERHDDGPSASVVRLPIAVGRVRPRSLQLGMPRAHTSHSAEFNFYKNSLWTLHIYVAGSLMPFSTSLPSFRAQSIHTPHREQPFSLSNQLRSSLCRLPHKLSCNCELTLF